MTVGGTYGRGTNSSEPSWRSLRIGQLRVDAVTQAEAIDAICALVDTGAGGRVYTPNIDHVVLAETDTELRNAYSRAALSLADGFPLVVTSKLTRTRLPEKVSGSDLVEPLIQRAAERGYRVFFLGGGPGIAESAAAVLTARYPALQVAGCAAPMVAARPTAASSAEIGALLQASGAQIVLVAMGAPKQELLIDAVADAAKPAVLLGIGASLDFIAGKVKRAPKWMSENGLEWLYRLNQERGRLWRRYLRDTQYPLIVAKHAAMAQWKSRGTRT
jgi:N-acetylglucosaminyldiphosphoundecaprenol N-acetyl-beta-D-mannosaminyltransferase